MLKLRNSDAGFGLEPFGKDTAVAELPLGNLIRAQRLVAEKYDGLPVCLGGEGGKGLHNRSDAEVFELGEVVRPVEVLFQADPGLVRRDVEESRVAFQEAGRAYGRTYEVMSRAVEFLAGVVRGVKFHVNAMLIMTSQVVQIKRRFSRAYL